MERSVIGKFRKYRGYIAAAAIGATLTWGADKALEEKPAITFDKTTTGNNAPPETESELIERTIKDISVATAISNFRNNHYSLQQIPSEEINLKGDKFGLISDAYSQLFITQTRNHVKEGVVLVNHLIQEETKKDDYFKDSQPSQGRLVKLDSQTSQIQIDGLTLDLNNPYHLRLASAIIFSKIDYFDFIQAGYPVKSAEEAQNELVWLANSGANVTMDKKAAVLVTDDNLRFLSRSLKTLTEIKIPYPSEIIYKIKEENDPTKYAAWYWGSNQVIPFRMAITEEADRETIYHEIGHFVSDSNHLPSEIGNEHLKMHSQEAFTQMLEKKKSAEGLRFSTVLVQLNDDGSENYVEEYAEAFRKYFYSGRDFRKSIFSAVDPQIKTVLQAEYAFMKSLARGLEFDYGLPIKFLAKDIKIKKFDSVRISNLDLTKEGVLLYPQPDMIIENNYPLIEDSSVVTVLSDPLVVEDISGNQTELYQVKYSYRTSAGLQEIEGWVSRDYFSDLTPANRLTIPQTETMPVITPTATP